MSSHSLYRQGLITVRPRRTRTWALGLRQWESKGMFSSLEILQNFSDFPSHRIFGHTHEALNIDKK
jgi:hypothetical protein